MSVKKLNGQFHQLMQKEEWTDMDQLLDLCIASKPSVDFFSPSPFLLFEPSGDQTLETSCDVLKLPNPR